jgi:hypothetical protein
MNNSTLLLGPNSPIVSNNYHSRGVIKKWLGERMAARRLAKAEAKLAKTLQRQRSHFRNSAAPLPYDIMEDFPNYPKPPPPIPISSYNRTFNTAASPIVLTPFAANASLLVLRNRPGKTRRKGKKSKKSRKHLAS